MYCAKHGTESKLCGCTMEQINEYAGKQIRLSELDMMQAELELMPVGTTDVETLELEVKTLTKVVVELINLVRKELY